MVALGGPSGYIGPSAGLSVRLTGKVIKVLNVGIRLISEGYNRGKSTGGGSFWFSVFYCDGQGHYDQSDVRSFYG